MKEKAKQPEDYLNEICNHPKEPSVFSRDICFGCACAAIKKAQKDTTEIARETVSFCVKETLRSELDTILTWEVPHGLSFDNCEDAQDMIVTARYIEGWDRAIKEYKRLIRARMEKNV